MPRIQKSLLTLALAALLAGAGLAAAAEKKGDTATYPAYLPLTPPLVVNLANPRRAQFLQLAVQLYVATAEDAAAVNLHMPAIRDRLITFFGGRDPEQVQAVENREKLREEALEQIREVMTAQHGSPAVDGLFFTNFIVQ